MWSTMRTGSLVAVRAPKEVGSISEVSGAAPVDAGAPTAGSETILPGWTRPVAGAPAPPLPESWAYRLKKLLLGPPLISEQLSGSGWASRPRWPSSRRT